MMDAGLVTICNLENVAEPGRMPDERLRSVETTYFEDRVVGYSRYYAALGVNETVDLVVRTWRLTAARAGMYAVLSMSENDGQYRIAQVQHILNDDGLKVTDLSLTRLGEFYELATET